jgi:hypothetical protein
MKKAKNLYRKIIQSWRKEVSPPLNEFTIPGALNIHDSPDYRNISKTSRFSPSYNDFQDFLINAVEYKKDLTFYKYGDGDYYFLKGEENGSAAPGKRALSKQYSEIDLPRFQSGSKLSDFYMCEIPDIDRERFQLTFPGVEIDFPAEYVYGAVSSRWVTREFDGKIGIIGGSEKIDLIDSLLNYSEYMNYLGLSTRPELIRIPQKFACDDLDRTINQIKVQLTNSKCDIFVFGVGHVKSGIIGELKKIHPAVYLDIGSGVDALAGVIDIRRPYFGSWTNFQLPSIEAYKDIDYLQVSQKGQQFFLTEKQ